MLEYHGYRVARIVERHKALEQGVVAQLEGQRGIAAHAARALGHGDGADLRRAGLAGEQHIRDRKPRCAAGAAAVDHVLHRIADDGQMFEADAQRPAFMALAVDQEMRLSSRPVARRAAITASWVGLTSI